MNLNRMLAPGPKRDAIDLLRDYNVRRFVICPNMWRAYQPPTPPLQWKRVKFDRAGVKSLPDNMAGIYSFVAIPDIAGHPSVSYLLYIGETTRQTLRQRCASYLDEPKKLKPREHIKDMVMLWPDHLWLYYATVSKKSTILRIEERLISAYLPPFNSSYTAMIKKAGKLRRILCAVLTK